MPFSTIQSIVTTLVSMILFTAVMSALAAYMMTSANGTAFAWGIGIGACVTAVGCHIDYKRRLANAVRIMEHGSDAVLLEPVEPVESPMLRRAIEREIASARRHRLPRELS